MGIVLPFKRKIMRAEDVYGLGPNQMTMGMLDSARATMKTEVFEEYEPLAAEMLKIAQKYYRLGAFNMEHRDGKTCEAEDQAGWPVCSLPAEYYVLQPNADGRRIVYCSIHREKNRFFRPEHMAPIFMNPDQKDKL